MTTNFPLSLDSFTTKIDNLTDVMAADANNLQDSVLAIETLLGGPPLGWYPIPGTVTYVSATSFTISGDLTAIFKKGVKVKLTNSTVKYGYVLSSSYSSPNTTVNLIPNTSYSLAAGTITGLMVSYSSPPDFPGWFVYSADVSGETGTIGTYAELVYNQKFSISGRILTFSISKKITNLGSWTGNVQVLLPVAIVSETLGLSAGGILATAALAVKANPILLATSTYMKFMKGWNSTYATFTDLAVNDFILLRGSYEI